MFALSHAHSNKRTDTTGPIPVQPARFERSAVRPRRNKNAAFCLPAAISLSLIPWNSAVFGANSGTWTNLNGGLWGTTGNWIGGKVADGTDAVADFSTLDVSGARIVNLNTSRTIGALRFGDAVNPSHDWSLSNNGSVSNAVTLATSSGIPSVVVLNQTLTISASVKGGQGFAKSGAGALILGGSLSYSGATEVHDGVLKIGVSATMPAGARLYIAGQSGIGGPTAVMDLNGTNQAISQISGGSAFGGGGIPGRLLNSGSTDSVITIASGSFGGVISDGPTNRVGVIKSGNFSSLILTGDSTYSGPTTVSNGSLTVHGSLGNTNVLVKSGAYLTGSGTIRGLVTMEGGTSLAPSGSTGSSGATQPLVGSPLTILGDVSYQRDGFSGTQLLLSVASASGPGIGYDQIRYGGSMNFDRTSIGMVDTAYKANKNPGDMFWIIEGLPGSSPVGGLLYYGSSPLADGAAFANTTGVTYVVHYNVPGNPNGSGNNVLLTVLPEPSGVIASLLSLGVVLPTRNRRNRFLKR